MNTKRLKLKFKTKHSLKLLAFQIELTSQIVSQIKQNFIQIVGQ